MPKMPTLKAAAALSALAVGSACAATDEELASLVAEDVKHPVRPAGVDGQPVWNDNAIWFQYPPVLRFSDRQDVHYRVRIFDSDGKVHMQGPAGFVRWRLGEDTVRQGGGLGRDDPAQPRALHPQGVPHVLEDAPVRPGSLPEAAAHLRRGVQALL